MELKDNVTQHKPKPEDGPGACDAFEFFLNNANLTFLSFLCKTLTSRGFKISKK